MLRQEEDRLVSALSLYGSCGEVGFGANCEFQLATAVAQCKVRNRQRDIYSANGAVGGILRI